MLKSSSLCLYSSNLGTFWLKIEQFWPFEGPSKDHSTKVWLQLAQWFLRRRLKCEMLTDGRQTTDDGRKVMTIAHMA